MINSQKEIYRDSLAGVQYSDYQRVKGMKAGDKLTLRWEMSNPVDPKAIAVYHGKYRIGYIKAGDTTHLHKYRVNGIKCNAELVAFNHTNPTWQMLTIRVTVPIKRIFPSTDDFLN